MDLDAQYELDHAVGKGSMVPSLLRSSSPPLWYAIRGVEDSSRHGMLLDEKVPRVSAKLGNAEQLLVDQSGACGTSKVKFAVSISRSDQAWSLQSLWALFKTASRPRNVQLCFADRAAERLDRRVVNILPLAPSLGNPSGLVALGDCVVEGLVNCSIDMAPRKAALPKSTIALSNAIFEEIGWVEKMSVKDHQDVLTLVSKAHT